MELYPFYRKNIFKNYKTFKHIFIERKIIKNKYKKEDIKAIISSGGYVSIPPLLSFNNSKKILLESNMILGLANKILSIFVDNIFTQFPTIKNKKAISIGNPHMIKKNTFDHPFFYLNKKLVLFIGGSNGALEIVKIAKDFNDYYPNINIFVITGERYFETYEFNENARVFKRIDDISSIFHKFDLIISRAGGSTITEILATNSCSILFPSKNVSANHQYKNAKYLKDLGVVEMVENYTKDTANFVYDILSNKEMLITLKSNCKKVFLENGNEYIKKAV
jgi:UDP-N-acetylglucosamine--N-acetylmuramyl-(pentapeptide) pyrophosphoryl-undecaprenol N-acetylglucosamine transferase